MNLNWFLYNNHNLFFPQGSTITTVECRTANNSLFLPNDICSISAQQLLNDNDSAIVNMFSGDCPTRFHAYVNACISNNEVIVAMVTS